MNKSNSRRTETTPNMQKPKDLYIGLMSGTSVDAVDAVIADLSTTTPRIIGQHSHTIPEELRKKIKQTNHDLKSIGELNTALGYLFSEATQALLLQSSMNSGDISAIGCHGQTVYHHPHGDYPFTLQLGDASIISARTKITTVSNFRNKDIAMGGQGAPLAPAFHQLLFQNEHEDRAVVNIGGIANISFLPANNKTIIGFDSGPGNTLLDHWAQQHINKNCDVNGDFANSGTTNPELLQRLLSDEYLSQQWPKSTGTEYFNAKWLEQHLNGSESPEDVQSTLTELTATSIAHAIPNSTNTIIICGGGVHNKYLMQRLQHLCHPKTVVSSNEFGIDPDWIEAMAFAWFAKQTIEKKPVDLSSVTGTKSANILGAIYY